MGTHRRMLPLVVLAWETFQETTLANQTKVCVGVELEINSGCRWIFPWCISYATSMVEPGGMSKAYSVRDRLSLKTAEGKLQLKVCLHLHLEQGGTSPMEGSKDAGHCSFLSYRWVLVKVPDSNPWIVS